VETSVSLIRGNFGIVLGTIGLTRIEERNAIVALLTLGYD